MNCPYCQTTMREVFEIYQCLNCPNEVRYQQFSASCQRTSFQVRVGNISYTLAFDVLPDGSHFFCLWKNISIIVTWEFFPDVTPYNVLSKLKTILVFL